MKKKKNGAMPSKHMHAIDGVPKITISILAEKEKHMQKKKTREEILAMQYLTKSDIRKLFVMPWATAVHVYQKAQEIDDKTLPFRVYPTRVRTSSVLKVTGYSYNLLAKQIKGERYEDNDAN